MPSDQNPPNNTPKKAAIYGIDAAKPTLRKPCALPPPDKSETMSKEEQRGGYGELADIQADKLAVF